MSRRNGDSKNTTALQEAPKNGGGDVMTLSNEDLTMDAGVGFEGTTSDDFLIPFMRVIQAGSPQMDPQHARFIESAKVGMIVNTATNTIMSTVRLLPCAYRREYVEWAPRESKEGILGKHPPDSQIVFAATKNDKGKLILDNGNSLVDTRYFACLAVNENNMFEPVVVAMASTQIKVGRSWMTRMDNLKFTGVDGKRRQEPIFARIWTFKTVQERNAQGTWYSWVIVGDGMPVASKEIYQAAKDFRQSFLSGTSKIDERAESEYGAHQPEDTGGANRDASDEAVERAM